MMNRIETFCILPSENLPSQMPRIAPKWTQANCFLYPFRVQLTHNGTASNTLEHAVWRTPVRCGRSVWHVASLLLKKLARMTGISLGPCSGSCASWSSRLVTKNSGNPDLFSANEPAPSSRDAGHCRENGRNSRHSMARSPSPSEDLPCFCLWLRARSL